jgi:Condensation domain
VSPPLSIGQERLWFLQRFSPDDISYNVYYVVRLRGPLEVDALHAAVDAVVARHVGLAHGVGQLSLIVDTAWLSRDRATSMLLGIEALLVHSVSEEQA